MIVRRRPPISTLTATLVPYTTMLQSQVFARDRDPDAIAEGHALVAAKGGALTLIDGRFSEMEHLLKECGVTSVSGVTLDIGVSSMQLDRADRGFSFQADGPLDMRMSQSGERAAAFLNQAPEQKIADVI